MKKINSLTSLRFFAAAMIVLFHSRGQIFFTVEGLSHWALNCGVTFFFVLSGFILSYVYPQLNNKYEIKNFYAARVARVWPAHLFFFLVQLFLSVEPLFYTTFNPFSWLINIFLLQAWVPNREVFFAYNSVSWTLSVEMFFYLLFPLLILNFKKNWKIKLTIAVGLVVLLVVICDLFGLQKDTGLATLSTISSTAFVGVNPLVHLLEFVVGMIAYLAWDKARNRLIITRFSGTISEILAIGVVVLSLYLTPNLGKIEGSALFEYLSYTAPAIPFGILIFIMAFESGHISQSLKIKPLVFLGEISYSIYLSHQIFLRFIVAHAASFSIVSEFMIYLIFWVFMIVFCTLVWALIERPSRKTILSFASR